MMSNGSKECLTNEKTTSEMFFFCLSVKSERKTLCYRRFFGTKLREKHGELQHKKAIRDVLLLKQFLTNEKHDKRK